MKQKEEQAIHVPEASNKSSVFPIVPAALLLRFARSIAFGNIIEIKIVTLLTQSNRFAKIRAIRS